MDRPLVSIITPTFNHERFIGQCLDSVLSQTFGDWEQIVVDDGSTDQTAAIVASHAAADPRVHLIRQQNKGIWRLSETYNSALDRARGKFTAILEGDDFWPEHKLAEQVRIHQQVPDLLFSYGRAGIFKSGRIIGENWMPPLAGLRPATDYLRQALLAQTWIIPVTAVMQRAALESLGGFHQDAGYPAVDFSTWVRVFQLDGSVMWIDSRLGYWRQSDKQATQTLGLEIAEGGLRIALDQFDKMPAELRAKLGLERRVIQRSRSRAILAPNYLSVMRSALRERDGEKAVAFAKKLIACGGTKSTIQAVCALLANAFGTDLEFVFRTYERLVARKIRA